MTAAADQLAELQRRLAELTTVQRVARAINSTLDLEAIFQTVVAQINSAFNYQMVSIYLREGDGLRLQAYLGYEEVIEFIGLNQGVSGRGPAGPALQLALAARLRRQEFIGNLVDIDAFAGRQSLGGGRQQQAQPQQEGKTDAQHPMARLKQEHSLCVRSGVIKGARAKIFLLRQPVRILF